MKSLRMKKSLAAKSSWILKSQLRETFSRIKNIITEILNDLSTKNVDKLEENGRIGRLTKEEIIQALKDFNCNSVEFPEDKFCELQPIEIKKNGPLKLWYLDIDLWCNGQPSDLTLSLILRKDSDGHLTGEISDLHVL